MSDGTAPKRQRTDIKTNNNNNNSNNNKPDVELLSAWFCPYAQRAWMALEEKCLAGSFRVTEAMKAVPPDDHYEKIPELLDANPSGLVPVIIDRRSACRNEDQEKTDPDPNPTTTNVVVYESMICVEYADEAFGPKPTLLPGSPARRAESRMFADYCDKNFCTLFYRLLMRKSDEERSEAAEGMLAALRTFSRRCTGPYFFGKDFTLVDIALAPWAVGPRMDVLNHYRGFAVPKTCEYAKYHEWKDAVAQRPSFKATSCDDLQAMIRSYRRYADGSALSKVGDAVRGGTAMP